MKKYWPLFLAFLLLFVDQLVKRWAIASSRLVANERFIFGLVELNTIVLSVILLLLLWWLVVKMKKYFLEHVLSFSLILSGALSNLLDRIVRGSVIDYFGIKLLDFNLSFNLADLFILLGAIIYAAKIFKKNNN